MPQPLVSIVIDNYNYGTFLRDAVDSALAQTYPHLEVVVVDDGSTDSSRAHLAAYGDRIRLVLKENGGQASAFNAGFAASRGEVICLLDSDDVAVPDRVERTVEAFLRYPRADWIRQSLEVVDADRRPVGRKLPDFRREGPVAPRPHLFIEGRVHAFTSAIAFRREIGERVFPLPHEVRFGDRTVSLVRDADAFLAFRFGAVGGWYASLPDVVGEYRRHSGQQFFGVADLGHMLRRQSDLGPGVALAFRGIVPARDLTPTTYHKHLAALAGLEGAPLWSRSRFGPALRGWARAMRLAAISPRLALRQSLGIAFATLLPRYWARRVLRTQGFIPAAASTENA